MGIYEELEWRGLIKDVSSPDLREKLNNGGMTFYIGTDFDQTEKSRSPPNPAGRWRNRTYRRSKARC